MSVYETLLNSANEGRRYKINLKDKTLKIGGEYYVKNGDVLVNEPLIDDDGRDKWEVIVGLYHEFKNSIPTEYSKKRSYFKALKYEELSIDDLAYGLDRYFAQAQLEGYILLSSLMGYIEWEDDSKWFCQPDINDRDLVVLKEWL